MKCTKFFALLAMVVATPAALANHLDNPNLLVDPSFEGTLTTDGPPFIGLWEGFSAGGVSSSAFTTAMPRTGAQALELNIGSATNLFAGGFQDVFLGTGLAGTTSYFSGWHKLVGTPGGSEIRIEWRNSVSNTEVSRNQITPSALTGAYEEFIVSAPIPVGADTARLVYAIQSFGGALNQQVFTDDWNFNVVPEPASAALAALTVAAGILRRRTR